MTDISDKLHFSIVELFAYLHTQDVNLHDDDLSEDLDIKNVLLQLITHTSTSEFTFARQATDFVKMCMARIAHHRTHHALVPSSFTFCYILAHKCRHQAKKHNCTEYCQYFTALTDYFDLLQHSSLKDY